MKLKLMPTTVTFTPPEGIPFGTFRAPVLPKISFGPFPYINYGEERIGICIFLPDSTYSTLGSSTYSNFFCSKTLIPLSNIIFTSALSMVFEALVMQTARSGKIMKL